MYKAILFDLDGTLTDSGEGITKSVQYALEKVGKPEPDLQKLRIFVGPPLLEQFQEYAGIDKETARKAVEIYRERYAPVGIYENELYLGIPEMLSGLKQRGYKLAIASSKPENFVKIVAEYFHIDSYFKRMGIFQFFFRSVTIGNCDAFQSGSSSTQYIMLFISHHDHLVPVFRKSQPLQRFLDHLCLIGSSTLRLTSNHPFKIVNSAEEILDFFA